MILPAAPANQTPVDTPSGLARVTIPVEGMTCFSCEFHVQGVLKDLTGVETADVSTAQSNVVVIYNPSLVNEAQIVEAINTNTGYHATSAGSGG